MKMNKKITQEEKEKEELWCNYSDLPSPLAYQECVDYDGMSNQGRVFTKKNK